MDSEIICERWGYILRKRVETERISPKLTSVAEGGENRARWTGRERRGRERKDSRRERDPDECPEFPFLDLRVSQIKSASSNACAVLRIAQMKYRGRVISLVKGSVCFVSEICSPSHFSPSPICGGSFITNPALNLRPNK